MNDLSVVMEKIRLTDAHIMLESCSSEPFWYCKVWRQGQFGQSRSNNAIAAVITAAADNQRKLTQKESV